MRNYITQKTETLAAGEEKTIPIEKPMGYTVCKWIAIKAGLESKIFTRLCEIVIGGARMKLYEPPAGNVMDAKEVSESFASLAQPVDPNAGQLEMTVKNTDTAAQDVKIIAMWNMA